MGTWSIYCEYKLFQTFLFSSPPPPLLSLSLFFFFSGCSMGLWSFLFKGINYIWDILYLMKLPKLFLKSHFLPPTLTRCPIFCDARICSGLLGSPVFPALPPLWIRMPILHLLVYQTTATFFPFNLLIPTLIPARLICELLWASYTFFFHSSYGLCLHDNCSQK